MFHKNDWGQHMINQLENYLLNGKTYKEISLLMNKSIAALHHAKNRYLKIGRQNQGMARGINRPNFKGYRYNSSHGYIVDGKSLRYEHRIIMEKFLGRRLQSNEVIHHINEDKTDNRLENLQVTNRSDHKKLHPEIGKESRFGTRQDN